MKIGFIGLGVMGKPMCRNLIKAGYEVVVFNSSKESVKEVAALGAEEVMSPKDVGERSEVIITMLPNTSNVEEVVLGENGILKGALPGSIIIDMSSIAPLASKRIAEKAAEMGIEMLDAPVSGGQPKAIEGTLAIMAGGKKEVFDKVFDILSKMGASVVYCGDIGSGNTTKLVNQIIVALNIAAISEALVFGTKAGVDPEIIYNAIRTGLAGSAVFDAKAPLIMDRNFKGGSRLELHIKDLINAMETGNAVGAPLPLTTQVMDIMQELKREGKQKDDHGVLVQFYEKLANIEVRRTPHKIDKKTDTDICIL